MVTMIIQGVIKPNLQPPRCRKSGGGGFRRPSLVSPFPLMKGDVPLLASFQQTRGDTPASLPKQRHLRRRPGGPADPRQERVSALNASAPSRVGCSPSSAENARGFPARCFGTNPRKASASKPTSPKAPTHSPKPDQANPFEPRNLKRTAHGHSTPTDARR